MDLVGYLVYLLTKKLDTLKKTSMKMDLYIYLTGAVIHTPNILTSHVGDFSYILKLYF